MRTSLNEIREAERFLTGNMQPEDSLLFQAKLITGPSLRFNVFLQSKIMEIVLLFDRRKMKNEIERLRDKLFNNPDKSDFTLRINRIFNN
ncbi:MAG: hypothetical protein WDN75_01075 [Bacteroidota bacterium]